MISKPISSIEFFQDAPASLPILDCIAAVLNQHQSDGDRQYDRLLIVAKDDGAVLYDLDHCHAEPVGDIDMEYILDRFENDGPTYDVTAELAIEGYLVVASRPIDGVTFAYHDRVLNLPPRARSQPVR